MNRQVVDILESLLRVAVAVRFGNANPAQPSQKGLIERERAWRVMNNNNRRDWGCTGIAQHMVGQCLIEGKRKERVDVIVMSSLNAFPTTKFLFLYSNVVKDLFRYGRHCFFFLFHSICLGFGHHLFHYRSTPASPPYAVLRGASVQGHKYT